MPFPLVPWIGPAEFLSHHTTLALFALLLAGGSGVISLVWGVNAADAGNTESGRGAILRAYIALAVAVVAVVFGLYAGIVVVGLLVLYLVYVFLKSLFIFFG